MTIASEMVSQHRLYIELNANHHTIKPCTLGRSPNMSVTSGVALEHRTALMGMKVHPAARSDTDSENMNRLVRSSRSCG